MDDKFYQSPVKVSLPVFLLLLVCNIAVFGTLRVPEGGPCFPRQGVLVHLLSNVREYLLVPIVHILLIDNCKQCRRPIRIYRRV